jgi:hypothetical protein
VACSPFAAAGFARILAVAAHMASDAPGLSDRSADEILLPFHDAADHAARRIAEALKAKAEVPT